MGLLIDPVLTPGGWFDPLLDHSAWFDPLLATDAGGGGYAEIEFIEATSGVTTPGAQDIDIDYPATIEEDDFLVMGIEWGTTTTTRTTPTGWVDQGIQEAGGLSPTLWVLTKVCDGTETGTLTVDTPSAQKHGQILQFRNVDPAAPLDVAISIFSTGSNVNDFDIPSMTPVTDGVALVYFGTSNSISGTFTQPNNQGTYTEVYDSNAHGPGGTAGYLLGEPAGATGVIDLVHGAASRGVAMAVALRPVFISGGGGSLTEDFDDAAGDSDSITVVLNRVVTYSDNSGDTDSLVLSRGLALTDNAGDTDSTVLARGLPLVDDAGDTDSLTRAVARALAADDAGDTDSLTRAVARPLTDDAGDTDSAAYTIARALALAVDNAGDTDSLALAINRALTLADEAGDSDSLTLGRGLTLAVENAGDTDSLIVVLTNNRVLADDAGDSDSVALVATRVLTLTDEAGDSDTTSLVANRTLSLTDGAGDTDSTTLARSVVLTTDNSGDTDSLTLARGLTITDLAGDTDSLLRAVTRTLSDNSGDTDAITRAIARTLTGDNSGDTDTLLVVLSHNRSITDLAGDTDSLVLARGIALVDNAGDTDQVAVSGDGVLNLAVDDAGDTDSLSLVLTRNLTIDDNAGDTDTLTLLGEEFFTTTDDVGTTDQITLTFTRVLNLVDNAGDTDLLDLLGDTILTFLDNAGDTDQIVVVKTGVGVETLPGEADLFRNRAAADLFPNTTSAQLASNRTAGTLFANYTEAHTGTYDTGAEVIVDRIKKNDTAPPWKAMLWADKHAGIPAPLNTATQVRVIGILNGVKIIDDLTATGGADGIVVRDWEPPDTDTVGTIHHEVKVTWGDGTIQTFPVDDSLDTRVYEDELLP